jgi:hypothetical protein
MNNKAQLIDWQGNGVGLLTSPFLEADSDRMLETNQVHHGNLPPPAKRSEDEGESERERLLRVWRLHPDAEVDLCSEEEQGGPDDGTGLVHLTEKDGTEVDEFRFGSADEADEAVLYALRAMNPGMG